jgi:hypothetical protein
MGNVQKSGMGYGYDKLGDFDKMEPELSKSEERAVLRNFTEIKKCIDTDTKKNPTFDRIGYNRQ